MAVSEGVSDFDMDFVGEPDELGWVDRLSAVRVSVASGVTVNVRSTDGVLYLGVGTRRAGVSVAEAVAGGATCCPQAVMKMIGIRKNLSRRKLIKEVGMRLYHKARSRFAR